MQVGPQCWTCLQGRVQCDGGFPACSMCKSNAVECAGYDVAWGGAGDGGGDGGDVGYAAATPASSGSYEELGMELAYFTSEQVPEPTATRSTVFSQPTPSLYRKAQMVFEGLDYFNKMICPDLVSLENHFNPYRVNLETVDKIPEIYVKVLVSVASFHRLMSHGPEPTSSSALIQKDTDVFSLRLEALQGLNELLSLPDQQISDATLLCVLSLMVASIQASAYKEWRAHLEGARKIIQMRGGLKKIVTVNPYFKPVLTFFMLIDVMGATTTPASHSDMPASCNMALKYWEIEPSVFQLIATTCIPCPDVLFRVIILVNYLRTVADYSTRMRFFNGWSTSGKEVNFIHAAGSPQTISSSSSSGSHSSAASSPATESSRRSDGDLWLSIGVTYRTSTLLYTLRTLVFDSEDEASELIPENIHASVETLRQETFEMLHGALVPVFADPTSIHHIGKLIMWPLFILGMETDYKNNNLRDFVTTGFSLLSQALGTLGPIGVVKALEVKWQIDSERQPGSPAKWDDYFQGREDFIVF